MFNIGHFFHSLIKILNYRLVSSNNINTIRYKNIYIYIIR